MSEQNIPTTYILLWQLKGERKPDNEGERPFKLVIFRGEMLEEIPLKEQIPREDETPAHNYRVYRDPDVTVYNNGTNVSPLHGAEADYLEGIEKPNLRAVEYLRAKKMGWVMNLIFGDEVYFNLGNKENVPLIIIGRIRYCGRIPGHRGVKFGIEIIEKAYRGKGTTDGSPHFQCGDNNAVYVSMDKIIKKKNVRKYEGVIINDESFVNSEATRSVPAQNTHSKTDKQIGEGSKKKEGGGFFEKVKAIFTGPPVVQPDSASHVNSQFSPNDRVTVQAVREKAVTGTVRWVGPVKISKESGGIVIPVVGIETDRKINVDKEFPDVHYSLTGSHGHHLFTVSYNHSRVFLPEHLVFHIDEYTKQKQEDNTFEVQEAKKWGLSVEEYRAQKEMLSKGNKERDKDHNNRLILPDNQQHEEHQIAGTKPDDSFPPMGPGDSVTEILGEVNIQEQREEYERLLREQMRRSSEDYELIDTTTLAHNRPNEDQHASSLPSNPVYQNVHHYSGSSQGNTDSSHLSPHSQHDHQGNNDQEQASQQQDNDLNHIPSGFAVGTMVQITSSGAPIGGVIQWIGIVPNYQGYVAGVELDIHVPMEGCTDGSWKGTQYFKCPPGRGLFCPLRSLQLDTRYMEPNQMPAAMRQELTNPLENKAPLFDDEDTPGGPELFSKYIGNEHGIQGHHNSCYLDATVFGLFALSDSFDMMLLEEPKHEVGQKIKHILWKGIVNPLRNYGLARHESIMDLRNELEELGRMKGANKDEKDPEEFLNLLFKEILHVDPFISIKRPFGVEKEYFIQLFFEIDPKQNTIPTTENLILKMFREQQISFTRVPSKLLLQMPRFGKEFKMYNRIIPSLEMDVKPLLDPSVRGIQECHYCKEVTATVFCSTCAKFYKTEEQYIFFCSRCSEVAHKSRKGHKVEEIKVKEMMADTSRISKMQLLSVICIETSHYVCYTRNKNRWLFHDSMANRIYDMYNIPKVTDVSIDLQHWVYDETNHQKILQAKSKDIPEYVCRFTQDIYMCVYINPDMDRYGPVDTLTTEQIVQVQSTHSEDPVNVHQKIAFTPSSYERSNSNPELQQQVVAPLKFTVDKLDSLVEEKAGRVQRKGCLEDLIVTMQQEIQQSNEDKEFLSSSFDQVSEGFKQLSQAYETLTSSYQKQETELSKIKSDMNTLQEDHKQLQRKKTKQEREQRVASEKAKKRENEVNEAYQNLQKTSREKYQKLREDHQKLQQDHEEMQLESLKLQQDHDTLQQEYQKQKQDLHKVQIDHQQLQTVLDQKEETHQTLEQECHKLHEANKKLQRDCEQLQTVLEQKERVHQTEKVRFEEQIRKLEESWNVSHEEVEITQEELGRGGWGVIRVGIFREQRVAVKELHEFIKSEHNLLLVHREMNTMSKLLHPNLLLFIGAVLNHPSGNPLIITEIMDASLRSVYERNQLTSERTKLTVLRDVAAGLNYLHCLQNPIIHRDVSSGNVLLESKGPDRWKAKLSDFGSANIARKATTTAPGTLVYSAPECMATIATRVKKKQTTKIDVFSFGVLLCEIMTCQFPTGSDQFHEMLESVATSSPPIAQLIRTCVEEEAENRPTIRTVIQQLDEHMKSLNK